MDDITLYMLIAGQVAMVLLGLIVFMFLFIRKLKAKNQELVSKTTKALAEASKLIEDQKKKFKEQKKKKPKEPVNKEPSIQSYLTEQLSLTQSKLGQQKDSDEAINLEGNPAEIAAKLRHHILQGELSNQAHLADREGFWAHYTKSLAPLVQAISELKKTEADPQVTSQLEDKIREESEQKVVFETKLEKIKTEWDDSFLEMDKLYSELVDTSLDSDKKEVLLPLIDKFQNNALRMGNSISGEEIQTVDSSSKLVTIVEKEVIEKDNSSELREASHEITRLRSVNEEQHKLISKLKDDLQHLDEDSGNSQIKAEYEQQVTQLENLMKENETCILTLEQELNSAHDKIDELQDALDNFEPESAEEDPDKSEEIKGIVDKFAGESRSLIDTIRNLERDLARYRAAEAEAQETTSEEINDPGVDALLSRDDDSTKISAMPGIKQEALVSPDTETDLIEAAVPKPKQLDEIPEDTPHQAEITTPASDILEKELEAIESEVSGNISQPDEDSTVDTTEDVDDILSAFDNVSSTNSEDDTDSSETSPNEAADSLDELTADSSNDLDLSDEDEEEDLLGLDTATSDDLDMDDLQEEEDPVEATSSDTVDDILDTATDMGEDLDLTDDPEDSVAASESAVDETDANAIESNGTSTEDAVLETADESVDLTDDLDALLESETATKEPDDQESIDDLLAAAAPDPEPEPPPAKPAATITPEEELAASEHLSEDLDTLLSDIESDDEDKEQDLDIDTALESEENPLGEEGLHLDDADIEDTQDTTSSIDYVDDEAEEENPLEDLMDAMTDDEDSTDINLDELEDSLDSDTEAAEEDPDALLQQLMEENNLNDDQQNSGL